MALEKSVLVVGGAGFVGSNIVDRLVKQGNQVIVVDDFSSGKKENLNIAAKMYQVSVQDEDLKKVFRRENIDVVYYASPSVDDKVDESEQQEMYKMHVEGFTNLLKNASEFNVRKVILISSLQVYGCVEGYVSEDVAANPGNYNGALLSSLENLLKIGSSRSEYKYSILRCSKIYGKRQTEVGEGGLIQKYINTLKRGSVPVIVGSETNLTDYIYISDVVNASVKLMSLGDNEVYNIANGDPKEIGKIVDILIKKTSSKVGYMVESSSVCKDDCSRIDITKAMRELDWRPVCSMELGLEILCKENM